MATRKLMYKNVIQVRELSAAGPKVSCLNCLPVVSYQKNVPVSCEVTCGCHVGPLLTVKSTRPAPVLHPSWLEPVSFAWGENQRAFSAGNSWCPPCFPWAADSRQSSGPALQPGSLDDSCLQGCSTVTNSSMLHSNCAPPLMLKWHQQDSLHLWRLSAFANSLLRPEKN